MITIKIERNKINNISIDLWWVEVDVSYIIHDSEEKE